MFIIIAKGKSRNISISLKKYFCSGSAWKMATWNHSYPILTVRCKWEDRPNLSTYIQMSEKDLWLKRGSPPDKSKFYQEQNVSEEISPQSYFYIQDSLHLSWYSPYNLQSPHLALLGQIQHSLQPTQLLKVPVVQYQSTLLLPQCQLSWSRDQEISTATHSRSHPSLYLRMVTKWESIC